MMVSPIEKASARLGSQVLPLWLLPACSSLTSSGAELVGDYTEVGGFIIQESLQVVVFFIGP